MNKKKILVLAMTLSMVAILAIGGTIAYFTDTDSAKNVMVTGNVSIVQNERQRPLDENGQPVEGATELEDFEQKKPLYPAVFYDANGDVIPADGIVGTLAPTHGLVGIEEVNGETSYSKNLLDKSLTNEVDKIVTVTNTGSRPVYARTIFLFENDVVDAEAGTKLSSYVHKYYTEDGKQNCGAYNKVADADGNIEIFEVNGNKYSAHIFYYDYAIEPNQTTHASLKQLVLDPNATNEVSELIGDEFVVLALSQAVQIDGFADDREALDAAFGEVTVENCQTWFAEIEKGE